MTSNIFATIQSNLVEEHLSQCGHQPCEPVFILIFGSEKASDLKGFLVCFVSFAFNINFLSLAFRHPIACKERNTSKWNANSVFQTHQSTTVFQDSGSLALGKKVYYSPRWEQSPVPAAETISTKLCVLAQILRPASALSERGNALKQPIYNTRSR